MLSICDLYISWQKLIPNKSLLCSSISCAQEANCRVLSPPYSIIKNVYFSSFFSFFSVIASSFPLAPSIKQAGIYETFNFVGLKFERVLSGVCVINENCVCARLRHRNLRRLPGADWFCSQSLMETLQTIMKVTSMSTIMVRATTGTLFGNGSFKSLLLEPANCWGFTVR